MRAKLPLCSILALAAGLASCSSPQESGTTRSNEKKNITITIANQSASVESRATGTLTGDNVKVADAEELYALFAKADGTLIGSPVKLIPSAAEPAADIEVTNDGADTYTFHLLDASVEKVAITNASTAAAASKAAVAATLPDLKDQQGALTNDHILVYGESGAFVFTGTQQAHDGSMYNLYDAGRVTVLPLLARIEISGIECFNLGWSVAEAAAAAEVEAEDFNGLLPRFGEITLNAIGIHNTPSAWAAGSAAISYDEAAWAAAWAVPTPPAVAAWNTDAIGTTLNAAGRSHDGVYVYNVVPGAVPNIILEIGGAQWNANLGVNTPAAAPAAKYYVRSNGLTEVTSFVEGTIYQVKYRFASEDIKTWNENSDYVCVEVEAIIPNWVVKKSLTPTFL